ncbi:triose-phosphate transporter family-domain-containing protein [Lipomyces tetrasporus]|uniref:Triose-phosphate transporter family-domain-containing protein n=1 Tax=Lipomyces tetrasporus TaxID=54092 RepID=A0AAD7QYL9_9ASCO|nr:triose-phosphate transporter family-domain-containing protein [Lipomyces tetrasporus]KAJ8102212.1 triose-phosphate transporter family-domain-containing protein [Lipomyces tetrasporus]
MASDQPVLPIHNAPATDSQQDSLRVKYQWLAVYFFFNLALTIYNKAVLGNFPFPYILTGIHTLCGTIGCLYFYMQGAFTLTTLSDRENITLFLFSLLYTINIAISNVSLNLVTVPFHQIVRAMTPFFTVIIYVIGYRKVYSTMTYISLIPVVAGVGFATAGDYYFTAMGFILTLLGAFLAALKTVVTNRVQTGRLRLSPLELLFRMSPLAFVQCLVYAYFTGEAASLRDYWYNSMTSTMMIKLLLNGAIAFGLNVVSFTANKKTGALTMTVAANVKQILTIVLAILFFHLAVTPMNAIGIILTLVGGAWYAKVELENKQRNSAASVSHPKDEGAVPLKA